MMKRFFLFALACAIVLIAGIAIFYRFHLKSGPSASHTEAADTLIARDYINRAVSIKGKNPDSAILLWHKAVKTLQPGRDDPKAAYLITSCYSQIARLYSDLSNYAEAKKYNEIAMALAVKNGDEEHKAYSFNVRGVLCFNDGDYKKALQYYNNALRIATRIKDYKFIGRTYTNIGIIYYIQGKCKQAVKNFTYALNIARKTKYYELVAGSYINIGLAYFNTSDYKNSEINYRAAIDIYKKINVNDGGIGICYQNLGSIYSYTGNYIKAIESHISSMQCAQKVNDSLNVARAHHNLGEIYLRLGDYNKGINEYIKSIKIKQAINDIKGIGEDYTGLGNLHMLHHNYRQASDYYQKSLKINAQLSNVSGKASDYANMASVFDAEGKNSKAILYYQYALKLHQQTGDIQGASDIYACLGTTYKKTKTLKQAESYFLKAIKQKTEISDLEGLAVCYYELADLYLRPESPSPIPSAQLRKSIQFGLRSLHFAEQIKALPRINDACLVLKKGYKKLGNITETLKYEERHSQLNDSIFSKAKTEAVVFAEARWNAERKQQVINNLENEKKLNQEIIKRKELQSQQQKIMLYAIIVIFLMLATVTVVFLKYRRKKRDALYQQQIANITSLRMQNIRNRMSPHFFFNVLSNIYSLTNNPALLKEKFNDLILLLRKTLENIEKTAIPLQEEIDIVKAFISIQRERIPEPFNVRFKIEEGVNIHQLIPAMIIQIPVENAIKHGLIPVEGPKELDINIFECSGSQKITIEDNGIGIPASAGRSTGTGTGFKVLMQIIQLLNSRNSTKIGIAVEEKVEGTGTIVEIEIPHNYSFNI